MSLAGTQAYVPEVVVEWGKKELKEQQLVTEYIVEALLQKGISPEVDGVETIKAGSILHLRALIHGKIKKHHYNILVHALHPTPAVCGMPLEASKKFIGEEENYDREYYTGYLGEVFLRSDQLNLFVNLRCLSFKESQLYVYVGGGITVASNPQLEWEETIQKTKTIKNIL